MQLMKSSEDHIEYLMEWFSSEQDLKDWAGPGFSYPYDKVSFMADLKLGSSKSFSLIDNNANLVAFGQYYLRLNKCHLGRLVVNPDFRGKGIARELMMRLCDVGAAELKVTTFSLFVLSGNESAIKAYKKFGFSVSHYPDQLPIENCTYMIKRGCPEIV